MSTRPSRFRSWVQALWQIFLKHPLIIVGIIIAIGLLVVAIVGGYLWSWNWTGMNRYIGPVVKANQQYRSEKTLWDWLQLLIIPVMLAVGGFWLNRIQRSREEKTTEQRATNEREAAEKRAQTERDIAADNQRETAMQTYFDRMSELLLREGLGSPQSKDEIRKIARVRTLTTLSHLDKIRKRRVLQFLYESGLLFKGRRIIDLRGANLSEADLSAVDLSGADLRQADLSNAFLSNADLSSADLSGANLTEAMLPFANLSETKLTESGVSWQPKFGSRVMTHTILFKADLTSAILSKADLRKAFMSHTKLSGANLNHANLSEAALYKADLSGANLNHANLSGAILNGAILSSADLTEADLSKSQLFSADLSFANLKDATGITNDELEKQARSLQGATMSDGSKHS